MKMQRGAWRAALEGTDLEPEQPAPKINRGAPRKISNIYARVERDVIRREEAAEEKQTKRK